MIVLGDGLYVDVTELNAKVKKADCRLCGSSEMQYIYWMNVYPKIGMNKVRE